MDEQRHQDEQRHKKVHFLHIGKTGGSAVRYALAPHLSSGDHVMVIGGWTLYLHHHDTKLRDVPEGEKVVFFLRDPTTRFTSGFFSRLRQGRPKYVSPWSPAEAKAFAAFKLPNQLARALSSTEEGERERAREAMTVIEHVKSSYWDWLESEEYLRSRWPDVLFVGFQEQLAEDFEVLKGKLGLTSGVALPTDDLHAHRTPAHLDRTLDAEALKNLREWYKGDDRLIRWVRSLRMQPDARAGAV